MVVHSNAPLSNGSCIYVIHLSSPWMHKNVTGISDPKAMAHSCDSALSLTACVYGLVEVPYDHLTEEEKTQSWFINDLYMIWRHYLKVESYSSKAPFWSNPEGEWWEVLPVGRLLQSSCSPALKKRWPDLKLYTNSWALAIVLHQGIYFTTEVSNEHMCMEFIGLSISPTILKQPDW